MRHNRQRGSEFVEGDLTPMIDMTFQLIAFFMVLVNFTDAAQDQRIHLPVSDLAKPPDVAISHPVLLQLTPQGTVLFAGDEIPVTAIRPYLAREAQMISRQPESNASTVTVIIRADAAAETGQVQALIEMCQSVGFRQFALRALARDEE